MKGKVETEKTVKLESGLYTCLQPTMQLNFDSMGGGGGGSRKN